MVKRVSQIMLLLVVAVTSSFFQQEKNEVDEYTAKTAFIYNFTKFVEWGNTDSNPKSSFVIGVIGDSPIQQHLLSLASTKTINGKKIEVVRCLATSAENCRCEILFVPENVSSEDFQEFISSLSTSNVLIISEKKGFLTQGSAINFLIMENKIKFEINVRSLTKSNLKASSQLLKLATNIQY
ncbi:MAG: YfiR family protein [Bacteroidota bacterium]